MKYVSNKVIRGESHYYLQYESVSEYLGPFIPDNMKEQMLLFFKNIGINKGKQLKNDIVKAFPFKNLQYLEEYHYWYFCISNSELFEKQFRDFIIWFGIYFSYNSNRAEGSKVTQPEIENFVLNKKRKPKTKTDREILNSITALQYAFSDKMKWNLKQIRYLHFLLLDGLDDPVIVGKWKNEENTAPGNQPTTMSKQVPAEMKKLVTWLNKQMILHRYPPMLALEFYTRFEKIHPFMDGNGRVGRILLNAILHKFRYMPVIFFTSNHRAHCEGLNQAIDGRSKKFNLHFLEQADKSFKVMSSKLVD